MRARCSICLFAAGWFVATPALADGTFDEGVALQTHDRYADALAVFRRAYRESPTPMSLLHVAECEVALGRFVKAESHLRMLADANILEGSPQDFFDAQMEARRALAALSPHVRTGTITIVVSEPNAKDLSVTLDDWPAQHGVPQTVDPGRHLVIVSAKDRLPTQATFDVQEGQSTLAPVGIGAYAPSSIAPREPLSPGLAGAGIFITILSGAALGVGGIVVFSSWHSDSAAIGADMMLGGLVCAAALGAPMIVVGKLRVRPSATVSARGVGLGLAF